MTEEKGTNMYQHFLLKNLLKNPIGRYWNLTGGPCKSIQLQLEPGLWLVSESASERAVGRPTG